MFLIAVILKNDINALILHYFDLLVGFRYY
jgi:hypothetical protein